MNQIVANNDIFTYVMKFLPNIDFLKYDSDNIIKDIQTISIISLISKDFYYKLYNTLNPAFYNSEKVNNYKNFLINSYELRKMSSEFFINYKENPPILISEFNYSIAEISFKKIYEKHNIQKKRKTILHSLFARSNRYNITFTEDIYINHIIIIQDILELAVLAVEKKHKKIIKKFKDISEYYIKMPHEVIKKYMQYIIDITRKRVNLFSSYGKETQQLMKASTWTVLFTILSINKDFTSELPGLYDIYFKKKGEILEEIRNMAGKKKSFPKKFCESFISHYQKNLR